MWLSENQVRLPVFFLLSWFESLCTILACYVTEIINLRLASVYKVSIRLLYRWIWPLWVVFLFWYNCPLLSDWETLVDIRRWLSRRQKHSFTLSSTVLVCSPYKCLILCLPFTMATKLLTRWSENATGRITCGYVFMRVGLAEAVRVFKLDSSRFAVPEYVTKEAYRGWEEHFSVFPSHEYFCCIVWWQSTHLKSIIHAILVGLLSVKLLKKGPTLTTSTSPSLESVACWIRMTF